MSNSENESYTDVATDIESNSQSNSDASSNASSDTTDTEANSAGILKSVEQHDPNMLSVSQIQTDMQTVRTTTDHVTNELVLVIPKDHSPPEKRNRYRLWSTIILICTVVGLSIGIGIGFAINGNNGSQPEVIDIPNDIYISVFLCSD